MHAQAERVRLFAPYVRGRRYVGQVAGREQPVRMADSQTFGRLPVVIDIWQDLARCAGGPSIAEDMMERGTVLPPGWLQVHVRGGGMRLPGPC